MPALADVPGAVRSLAELFALAHALELEAARRYAELGQRMRALDLPEVAAVFDALVARERQKDAAVERWAQAETGTSPDPSKLRWLPPDPFDEEAAEALASSRLASAYRAFSMAVRNEERAFQLWTLIAARANDARVREAAEALAREELRQAALLRRERRRAFHAARAAGAAVQGPATAAEVELALADGLARLAEATAPAAAAELGRLAAEAREMAAGGQGGAAPRSAVGQVSFTDVQRLAERAAELYLDAADTAHEEATLLRQQDLAARAIARIQRLRTLSAAG